MTPLGQLSKMFDLVGGPTHERGPASGGRPRWLRIGKYTFTIACPQTSFSGDAVFDAHLGASRCLALAKPIPLA